MFARFIRDVNIATRACQSWLECHPMTGWYIAFMVTINVVLNILDVLH